MNRAKRISNAAHRLDQRIAAEPCGIWAGLPKPGYAQQQRAGWQAAGYRRHLRRRLACNDQIGGSDLQIPNRKAAAASGQVP